MPAPIQVELVAHSAEWAQAAAREAERLRGVLGNNLALVHHIGSTAIPGIHAKPIIDLMPVVRSIAVLDAAVALVEGLGYQWHGEYGIAGRRYCTLDDSKTGRRFVQLHCYERGSSEIRRHLAFRDYLTAHPNVARAYDAEKQRCRELYPDNSHLYTDAKGPWIVGKLEAALAYFDAEAAVR